MFFLILSKKSIHLQSKGTKDLLVLALRNFKETRRAPVNQEQKANRYPDDPLRTKSYILQHSKNKGLLNMVIGLLNGQLIKTPLKLAITIESVTSFAIKTTSKIVSQPQRYGGNPN